MISTNDLSQSSHLHDNIGSSRYAQHTSEDSSTSNPGFVQSERGQVDSTKGHHDQSSLKRRISEIDTHEGMNTSSKSVRRRISRACDQCNQLRTKVHENSIIFLITLLATNWMLYCNSVTAASLVSDAKVRRSDQHV
jgi:hypothetical protein